MKIKENTFGMENRSSTNKGSRSVSKLFKPRIAAASALLFCISPIHYAQAELPEMSVFANAQEVPDEVLGETRGKFVYAGEIMSFGVRMVTEWITSSGEVINASGTLAVNMGTGQPSVSFEPVISVQQLQPVNHAAAAGNNIVSSGQGLENVSGVVQTIQVAGNTNGIGNSIGVSVRRYQSGNTAPSGSSTSNLNVTTPSGNSAAVALANNGLSVNVNVVNQGQAQQAIRSISQGNGQVLQSVRLGGDLNQIRNLINLDIQTRNHNVSSSASTQQLMSSLRQLSQSTPF
ncbi:hypothetical protein [Methylophaga sp.]|jgi:hypothetical protein|uniref:hypothetical protein n=1 Tax=Methylophaga sp. TaxID=2024840 RepID=UPI0014012E56|nr:hypothetical protein [Methylophaga sp.]MTI62902.1 hypothetical protein [Methylophaga sp.]